MNNLKDIKARYPDSQKNALGKKDMDNIRWLISECERLQTQNKEFDEAMTLAILNKQTAEAKVGHELQPNQFDIKDVTSRTQLQAEMNRHASWLMSLCLKLDLRSTFAKMERLRSFFAGTIDNRAKY